jgi:hypothetical protein
MLWIGARSVRKGKVQGKRDVYECCQEDGEGGS